MIEKLRPHFERYCNPNYVPQRAIMRHYANFLGRVFESPVFVPPGKSAVRVYDLVEATVKCPCASQSPPKGMAMTVGAYDGWMSMAYILKEVAKDLKGKEGAANFDQLGDYAAEISALLLATKDRPHKYVFIKSETLQNISRSKDLVERVAKTIEENGVVLAERKHPDSKITYLFAKGNRQEQKEAGMERADILRSFVRNVHDLNIHLGLAWPAKHTEPVDHEAIHRALEM